MDWYGSQKVRIWWGCLFNVIQRDIADLIPHIGEEDDEEQGEIDYEEGDELIHEEEIDSNSFDL